MKDVWLIMAAFVLAIVSFSNEVALAASPHCDFNKDGFDDLAVGIPAENLNGFIDNGAVNVLYGRSGGLSATNNQFWHRDSPNILGEGSHFDLFGHALACGDYNGDSFADLAISAPNDFDGAVHVLYGGATGLSSRGNQRWDPASEGLVAAEGREQFFGDELAAGDFNGDGFTDLAIGVSLTAEGSSRAAVRVLYGTSAGLSALNNQRWTQDSPGIADVSEEEDGFGSALVAADFGKDTPAGCFDDLAIAAPRENESAGAVHVLYGSLQGITSTGSQFFHQDVAGIPDSRESGDRFGSSLAAGSFGGLTSVCGNRKIADLVIGAPTESIDSFEQGAVHVLYGTNSGLTTTGNQFWHQDVPDITTKAEHGDQFGFSLVTGNTVSGHDYLAVGVPFEDLPSNGDIEDTGAVHVLYVSGSTGKLTAAGSLFFHEDVTGIKDTVERRDLFGHSLATGNFNAVADDDLAIGAPGESLNGLEQVGSVHILPGAGTSSTRFFHQNSADIKDFEEANDLYGVVLSNSNVIAYP